MISGIASTPYPAHSSSGVLMASFIAAFAIEAAVLLVLSHHVVEKVPMNSAPPPIEAEIFEKPAEQSHLSEEKPKVRVVQKAEPVLSKRVDMGKAATAEEVNKALQDQNQTEAAKPAPVSHGPVVISSDAPKLPSYLRDQNLKTNVLIEFMIAADGKVEAHLLGTSGNEELDALALRAARDWKFNPAVQNNQPIASKVRLRINFEVN